MTIEVRIYHLESETMLGTVKIENMTPEDPEFANYSIRFGTDRVRGVGVHQRAMYAFPRLRYNVLGLLRLALDTLDPEELELEDDVGPSDLARRFGRKSISLQDWTR